jgi:hypothetical protein
MLLFGRYERWTTMTPQEFKAWLKAMGISQRKAAALLDYQPETIGYWVAGKRRDGKPAPIPHVVALACAALYHRLKPWGPGSP